MTRLVAAGLGGAAIAALLFVAVLYFADLRIGEDGGSTDAGVPEVTVPDLVGESLDDAKAELEGMGLGVRIIGESTLPEWAGGRSFVVDQTPDGNTQAPVDATVTLDADTG